MRQEERILATVSVHPITFQKQIINTKNDAKTSVTDSTISSFQHL